MRPLPDGVPLFRPEAVRHRTDTLLGGILLPQPRYAGVFAIAALCCVASLSGLLFFGHYTPHVTTVGVLEPVSGVARVQSPRAGWVSKLWIHEGDVVATGDPLVTITSARYASTSDETEQVILQKLRIERDSNVRQMDLERSLNERERTKLTQEIHDAEQSEQTLRHLHALAQSRLELAQADETRTRDLVKAGFLAKDALDKVRDSVLNAQQALQELEQRLKEAQRTQASLQSELSELPLKLEQRLSELKAAVSGVDQRIAETESARDAVIRAPMTGRISALTVHPGESVAQQTDLFVIVPDDEPLHAKLLVPSRAIGFVNPGMTVLLRYDAFPYQKFGQHEGLVETVSTTALAPIEQPGPVKLSEPAYLVTVKLQDQTIPAYGKRLHLRPGMTLEAEMKLADKRVIEWILDPLYAAKASL